MNRSAVPSSARCDVAGVVHCEEICVPMPGIKLLEQMGNVKTAYNLTPEQLEQEIATADALIIRSATQARKAIPSPSLSMHLLTCLHTAILSV